VQRPILGHACTEINPSPDNKALAPPHLCYMTLKRKVVSMRTPGSYLALLFFAFISLAPAVFAQTTPQAPVPAAILTAKTIFVSNAGADSGLFPEPFSGDTDRAYNQFYDSLKTNGGFTLVDDPSHADLVLELSLQAPSGPSEPSKQKGASDPLPMFRLTIYDRKSHYVLWTFTNSINLALLQKTHDRNFDEALAEILGDFLHLAGKAPTAARPATSRRWR